MVHYSRCLLGRSGGYRKITFFWMKEANHPIPWMELWLLLPLSLDPELLSMCPFKRHEKSSNEVSFCGFYSEMIQTLDVLLTP